jgi:hypothetical protein
MLRVATDEDWSEMTGLDVPGHWIGLVCEDGGKRVCIGGLYEGMDGRWWATVHATSRRPVALWKAAREVLTVAERAGTPVHALVNPEIDGADRFLARCGFRPTNETMGGHVVWTR